MIIQLKKFNVSKFYIWKFVFTLHLYLHPNLTKRFLCLLHCAYTQKHCEYIYKKIQTIGFSKPMIKHEYFKPLLQFFILWNVTPRNIGTIQQNVRLLNMSTTKFYTWGVKLVVFICDMCCKVFTLGRYNTSAKQRKWVRNKTRHIMNKRKWITSWNKMENLWKSKWNIPKTLSNLHF